MTREEALEVFRAVKERSEHFKECGCRFPLWTITERDEEAIDMAIDALSEETSTIQEKHQLSEETPTNTSTKSTNTSTKSTNISTDASADRPRGEWIPVSEKLPREDQKCLVCHKGAIGIDEFIGHDLPYKWRIYLRDYDAWMPLPEPYKGGEDG